MGFSNVIDVYFRPLSSFWKGIQEHFVLKLEKALRLERHMRDDITKGVTVGDPGVLKITVSVTKRKFFVRAFVSAPDVKIVLRTSHLVSLMEWG